MGHDGEEFTTDIENIKKIPIVPTMLEVICRSTGMGFAAIARVTHDRWIACSVRDEIFFGLEAGGELQIETTICNEIRENQKAVIIDHVDENEVYVNHHTPKLYGFQSYISVPIFLKDGAFFGTLCAIDPKPALLNNTKTIGMFNLFADLISFHLNSIDIIEQNSIAVQGLNRQLTDYRDENRQYRHISNHNLQEPLRKIRVFSSMLTNAVDAGNGPRIRDIAMKIDSNAQKFSMMINDLSEFSTLNNDTIFEKVDLNKIVGDVCAHLSSQLKIKNAIVNIRELPVVHASPLQMEQLFYNLISNAIKFSKKDVAPVVHIYAGELGPGEVIRHASAGDPLKYVEVIIEDNGIGIEKKQLEKIFDIFTHLPYDEVPKSAGIGLAYCRKITRNHGGTITPKSEPGKGTAFSIILPAGRSQGNS